MFAKCSIRTSTFPGSTWCLVGSNRFGDMQPCNSILPGVINMGIKQTSTTIGTRPITISATCHKYSPFSVTFSASKSESSISKPSLSFKRMVLRPAKSSLLLLILLPTWARSQMWSPNSCELKTAMMASILTLWSMTFEYYSTICKTQYTTCHYTLAHGH